MVIMVQLFKTLVLPPASLFIAMGLGLLVARRWPRAGRGIACCALLSLLALCTPYVAWGLLDPLQRHPAISPGATAIDADVIVVLGADFDADPAEWGSDQPGQLSLERCRYGAALARRTGLPLVITGGVLRPDRPALSVVLRAFVEDELSTPVAWIEEHSRNTRQNALLTVEMLGSKQQGAQRVALVTHAWHMPRARAAFERAGVEVLAAPLAAISAPESFLAGVTPRAKSFYHSFWALHEWLGMAWYALRR